jgi:hypothetical protein
MGIGERAMNTSDPLDALVAAFAAIPTAQVGCGPRHPHAPELDIQPELNEFLSAHLFLRQDVGYVQFLERYCGASVRDNERRVVLDISGLSGVSLDLTATPAEFVDDYGFGTFASAEYRWPVPGEKVFRRRHAYFAFDATQKRLPGVYQCVQNGTEPPTAWAWASPSFLDWLNAVIAGRGNVVPA